MSERQADLKRQPQLLLNENLQLTALKNKKIPTKKAGIYEKQLVRLYNYSLNRDYHLSTSSVAPLDAATSGVGAVTVASTVGAVATGSETAVALSRGT